MSLLTRRIFSSRGILGIGGGHPLSIRNINYLNPRLTPILSSTINHKNNPLQLAVVPSRKSSTGSHVALWTAEKALSAALLPIIPAAFMFPSPVMDYLLAFTVVVHSHWGIEAIVVDYVRPSVFGETIPKIALALVYAFSAATLGGLCYFTYSDVGLVEAIKLLWKL